MPVYPLLAWLAACGWQWLFSSALRNAKLPTKNNVFQRTCWGTLLALLLIAVVFNAEKNWEHIAPTDTERNAMLEERITGYRVLTYLRQNPFGMVYQFGLEDAIYYAPSPIWGDQFGPGRHRDFAPLKSDQLSAKLKGLGFSGLLVHTKRWPNIDSKPDFNRHFSLIYEADDVRLYRMVDSNR
jgi:hypothetical protein